MENKNLERLLEGLRLVGVERGGRIKAVAEKTGYSESTVNKILSGHANLTSRFIKAVCSAFKINQYWVETGEETSPKTLGHENIMEFTRLRIARKNRLLEGLRLAGVIDNRDEVIASRTGYTVDDVDHNFSEFPLHFIRSICVAFGINETWVLTGNGEWHTDSFEANAENVDAIFDNQDRIREKYLSEINEIIKRATLEELHEIRKFVHKLTTEERMKKLQQLIDAREKEKGAS